MNDVTFLAPVQGLTSHVRGDRIDLKWDAADDVSGYLVELSQDGHQWAVMARSKGPAYVQYVAIGDTYYYRVRAVSRDGLPGDPSQPIIVLT